MAQTVSELLVKITSTGDEETAENLERSQAAFEDTADAAEEQLGMLEEFSKKWQNAMTVVVTGLAVASAGLLSQVPVLGEAFAGLMAVMNAVAFQMDKRLRPALQPVTSLLFDISNKIYSAEGAVGAFIGALGNVVAAIGAVILALTPWLGLTGSVSAVLGTLASIGGVVVSALTTVGAAIAAVVAGVSAAAAAVAIAVVAIIGFLLAYITNFMGVRDKTNRFVGQIIQFFKRLAAQVIAKARELWQGVTEWVGKLTRDVSQAFVNLVQSAFRSGRNLVNEFIDGMRSRLGALRRMADRVADTVRGYLPFSPAAVGPLKDLDRAGPALVETVASGMESSTGRLERASGQVAMAASPEPSRVGRGGGGGGMGDAARQFEKLVAAMQNSQVSHTFEVDGRELARSVTPMIGEGAVRSGATQVRR